MSQDLIHDAPERLKSVIDALSIGTAVTAFIGWLPNIAALASLVWTVIRIYETDTVQRMLGRKRC